MGHISYWSTLTMLICWETVWIPLKENTETLLEASRDVGIEINAEKTKYMIMSRHPNSGRNQNKRTANETFQKVATFKYLGTTITNRNDIHDEIKIRLNSGNACYY
jgi:hypothetical protein